MSPKDNLHSYPCLDHPLKNIYEQKLCLVDAANAEQYPKLRLILSRHQLGPNPSAI